jgi:hypothetical protein
MAFRDALDVNQPAENTESAPAPSDRDISPFSMGYDTERYALTTETTDQMLTLLLAITNLL